MTPPFRCDARRAFFKPVILSASEGSLIISGLIEHVTSTEQRNSQRSFAALRMTALLRTLACIALVAIIIALQATPGIAQSLFTRNEDILPAELERVYIKGIQFLMKTQRPDGGWANQYGSEPAVVGLCMMSILAHGEDPNFGPYSATIKRSVEFILKNQNEKTGYIGTTMYNHGFATLALAEAYGALNNEPRLGPALQKAVDLILTSQSRNPFHAWRYSPEASDADTTVSGAQLVALFAARNAGIGVPDEAIKKALRFFVDCQTPDGGIGYVSAGGPNSARTAIGALVFALAKQEKSAAFRNAVNYLKENPGDDSSYFQYYLYYAAQAWFRVGPAAFNEWNSVNLKMLTASQAQDGSWPGQFGPAFSTSASLLSLALNYRLLPIYER